MTTALATRGTIAESLDQIFEPLKFETLADLFRAFHLDREKLTAIAGFFTEENKHLIAHFMVSPEHLFQLEPALESLTASYWQRALDLTDVLESMPQARRNEWHKQIKECNTPPFDETSVISTLQNLLAQRHKFFAERVDGVFHALSPDHITNRPEGFSNRMILNNVYNSYPNTRMCGIIHDLRCVIARFMGYEEPSTFTAYQIVTQARENHCGDWVLLDGGTLRIRLHKKGTAHLEVHPEMAWRLNAVLASIYPNAIPGPHRTRPKSTPPKDFQLYNRPLPHPVIEILIQGHLRKNIFSFSFSDRSKIAYRDACNVLVALGGVSCKEGYAFDYDAGTVISEVILSGVIPDQRAYQFYPTPQTIAQQAISLAQIEEHHSVLEPSAGQGGLAEFFPNSDQATLIEVSPLHCTILRSKGFQSVLNMDFLAWNPYPKKFDRILMNPPFMKTQWLLHLEHASKLLSPKGRLVAILPTSAKKPKTLPGWSLSWSDPIPFPGTSIEVTILTATPPN